MSNYSKITNFATKDTLPSGNSGKIVKGTEIDDEFNAIASAVASKADTNSPAFTGTPTAPTALAGTNTLQLATTSFVTDAVTTLSNSTTTNLALKAPLASPALTGAPTAPTAAAGTNTTQLATTAFVTTAVSPKAPSDSPSFTGAPTAPTPGVGTNSSQLATTAFVNSSIAYALPSGAIIMWNGSSAPSGWYLCNGANGTPDLRNRFIVGAGSTYAVGATGGSADAIVPSHTHSATSYVSDPGHSHNYLFREGGYNPWWQYSNDAQVSGTTTRTTTASGTGITVSTSIASAGVSATNANLPPYYALAYIMKA